MRCIHLETTRDIHKTCRFCLKSLSEFSVNIFRDQNGFSLVGRIKDILVFQFQDVPKLPRNACLDCVNFLTQLSVFAKLARKTNYSLMNGREPNKKTCRFCCKSLSEFSVNIFLDANGFKLIDQIKNVLVLKFEDKPNWPRNACLDCVDFLMQLKNFEDIITTSHGTLRREKELSTKRITQSDLDVEEMETEVDIEIPTSLDFDGDSNMDSIPINEDHHSGSAISEEDPPDITQQHPPKEITSAPTIEFEFPITDYDVFLKVQDDLQRNEQFANALKQHFKTESLDLLFSEEILLMFSASGYGKKIKISSSPLFMCVANSWVTDARPLSVVLADISRHLHRLATQRYSDRRAVCEIERKNIIEIPDNDDLEVVPTATPTAAPSKKVTPSNPPKDEIVEKTMMDMKLFWCKVCDGYCETFLLLRCHVREEHKSQFRNYEICCNVSLNCSPQNLYDHIRLHLEKDAFKCGECGKCYKSGHGLNAHKSKYHTEDTNFVCSICGLGFAKFGFLKTHQLSRHGPKYKCEYCGVELTKRGLRNHVLQQHENVVNYLCDLCGRGFAMKHHLCAHISDHGGPHGGRRRKKPKAPKADLKFYDKIYFED